MCCVYTHTHIYIYKGLRPLPPTPGLSLRSASPWPWSTHTRIYKDIYIYIYTHTHTHTSHIYIYMYCFIYTAKLGLRWLCIHGCNSDGSGPRPAPQPAKRCFLNCLETSFNPCFFLPSAQVQGPLRRPQTPWQWRTDRARGRRLILPNVAFWTA